MKSGVGTSGVKAAVLVRVLKEDLSKEVTCEQRPEGSEEWVVWTPVEEHPRQREQQLQRP